MGIFDSFTIILYHFFETNKKNCKIFFTQQITNVAFANITFDSSYKFIDLVLIIPVMLLWWPNFIFYAK